MNSKRDSTTTDALAGDLPAGIGNPARRAFAIAGITRLDQMTKTSEVELLKLHGVGPKAIRIIKEAMALRGMAFAAAGQSRSVSERANKTIPRRAPKQSRKVTKS